MGPTVSVVLPVYNRHESLHEAIRSVLDQTFKDLELIVVDDASPISTEPVVSAFNDPRIRYVRRGTNGGAAQARNTGVAMATGEFVAFQDSDDIWLPGKLARQVKLLRKQSPAVGGVFGGKILYGRDQNYNYGIGKVAYAPRPSNRLSLKEDQVRRTLTENRLSLQNSLVRRDCLPSMPCFDPVTRANVDWGFALRLVQKTRLLEQVDPVVLSVISEDSISKNLRYKAISSIRILKQNLELYQNYPKDFGDFLFYLGSLLRRSGRKRAARRMILLGLLKNRRNILRLLAKFCRPLSSLLAPRKAP